MATTIYDIAANAGISYATVSRALRNDPKVAQKTREKIVKEAIQLGYHPNLVARALCSRKSKTIGFLTTFYTEISMAKISAFEFLIRNAGYDLYLVDIWDEPARALHAAEQLKSRGVDGLLAYGMNFNQDIEKLTTLGIPTVFLDYPKPSNCLQVVQDRGEGIHLAIKLLISLGHREIYMFHHDADIHFRECRLLAFVESMAEVNLGAAYDNVYPIAVLRSNSSNPILRYEPDELECSVKDFIRNHPACTAILCHNDAMAISVINTLSQMGVRVPEAQIKKMIGAA